MNRVSSAWSRFSRNAAISFNIGSRQIQKKSREAIRGTWSSQIPIPWAVAEFGLVVKVGRPRQQREENNLENSARNGRDSRAWRCCADRPVRRVKNLWHSSTPQPHQDHQVPSCLTVSSCASADGNASLGRSDNRWPLIMRLVAVSRKLPPSPMRTRIPTAAGGLENHNSGDQMTIAGHTSEIIPSTSLHRRCETAQRHSQVS